METVLKVFAALPRYSKLKPRGFNVSLEVSFYALEKQTEMKARWHDMQLKDFHNFLWLHLSVDIGSDFGPLV
jgi:hypothetical protein